MSSKRRKQEMVKSPVDLELGFKYDGYPDLGSLLDEKCSETEKLTLTTDERAILKYLNGHMVRECATKTTSEQVKTCLRNHAFHFIHVNVISVEHEESHKEYLPLELSINTFSFQKGLTDQFHCFPDQADIPLGSVLEARSRSQVHCIPVYERDELHKLCKRSLKKIVEKVNDIVGLTANSNCGKLVCFTFPDQIAEVLGCFQWLTSSAASEGITMPELLVFSVVDLVFVIGTKLGDPELKNKRKTELEFGVLRDEFENGLDCEFHRNCVRSGCSLGQTRKLACVFSDLLAEIVGVSPLVRYKTVRPLEETPAAKADDWYVNKSVKREKTKGRAQPPRKLLRI